MHLKFVLLMLIVSVEQYRCDGSAKDGFLGTAELIQSGRRSRLSREFPSPRFDKSGKLSDDAIREYGQLLHMDTKNFSDQQKVLLEKIVERVARLGGANVKVDAPSNVTEPIESNENEGRGTKNRLKKNKNQSTAPTAKATIKHDQHDGNGKLTVKHHTPAKLSDSPMIKMQVNVNNNDGAIKANVTDVMFGNITTSSIVDSLSSDNAREDIQLKKRPVGAGIVDKTSIKVSSVKFSKKLFISPRQIQLEFAFLLQRKIEIYLTI